MTLNINSNSLKYQKEILNYRVMIEESICWQQKDRFFEIIDKFLGNKISANSFRDEYWNLTSKICEKTEKYTNLIETNNITTNSDLEIYFVPKATELSNLIMLSLFTAVEIYSPEISDTESSSYGYSSNGLKTFIKDEILPYIIEYRNI